MIRLTILVAIIAMVAVNAVAVPVASAESDEAYLFAYFKVERYGGKKGETVGMRLAYSYDALNWTALADERPFIAPEVGKGRLLRDPSIAQGPDGTFHLVWTTGWWDRTIGHASSKNLVHWSSQQEIPVMAHEPTAKNCWAPEVTYNSEDGLFYIYWASTIPERKNGHSIYLTTTKDWKKFSPTRIWFNPPFSTIDAALLRVDDKWLMAVKNEEKSERNIRILWSDSLAGGWDGKEISSPVAGGREWVEGPSPLKTKDGLFVYFDRYKSKRYGAVKSTDGGKTWRDVSESVVFPKGIRHGTAFSVPMKMVKTLIRNEMQKSTRSTGLIASGGRVKSVVHLLPGEVWWGGGGGDGQNQPYGIADSRRIDLRRHGHTSSPLLVSSCGRYIWSEKPFGYQFKDGKLIIDSDVEKVSPVDAGKTLKDAYLAVAKAHMRFAGKAPPHAFFALPQWNNWMEIFLNGMDQKATDDYTDDLSRSGFPCGIYMVDGGWMSHQGSYEFYAKDFPDPKGMVERIRSHGWIPLIWTAHFVSPDSREYKKLRYNPTLDGLDYLAYFNNAGSRETAIIRWWSGASAIYDLTNPQANAYYVKRLKSFAEKYGIAGFKFDAGDPKFFADCRFHDESAEPVDYQRLYAELAAHEFPYNEVRGSWKCGGLPLVTRLKDKAHAWTAWKGRQAQDVVIPQVIAAGLVGCPYVVADMVGGGLEISIVRRKIDEKLFVRSAAMNALLPMMQFSLLPERRLSPENVKISRRFADLHVQFAPYILELVQHAAKTGEPIVRAMEYEFPHQGFNRPMLQFMLGGKWLVAPVITPDDAKTVELPAGEWRDDLGDIHVGPKIIRLEKVPLDRLPRFERVDRISDRM